MTKLDCIKGGGGGILLLVSLYTSKINSDE